MPRILIIDDSEAVLVRAKNALVAAGFEVITTSQTVGAARHLRSCDLVIVDYYMPGIDGKGVLDSLRHATETRESPPDIYLYTSDTNLGRRGRQLGFDGFFSNKGDDDALVSQVKSALRLRELRLLRQRS
jgi:two-component system, OmpR family, response regulator